MSPAPRTLVLRGCPLHYWLAGPSDGPLVVLVHGVTMDHRMFDPQVPALTAAGYRVLTVDVRGHGRSQPLGDGFTIGRAADDLLAVLDAAAAERAAGADPAVVVGHSMGGYIAQDLVFRHPERVHALAVVGGTCSTFQQPLMVRAGLPVTTPGLRVIPDLLLRPLLGALSAVHPEVRAYATSACRQVSKADLLTIWEGIAGHFHHEPGYCIEHPLLITHGAWDYGIGFGAIPLLAPRWAAREPRCRYEVIPAAGHMATQDNPTAFNRLLLEFLAASRAPTA